jgi:hypothetical protein
MRLPQGRGKHSRLGNVAADLAISRIAQPLLDCIASGPFQIVEGIRCEGGLAGFRICISVRRHDVPQRWRGMGESVA